MRAWLGDSVAEGIGIGVAAGDLPPHATSKVTAVTMARQADRRFIAADRIDATGLSA